MDLASSTAIFQALQTKQRHSFLVGAAGVGIVPFPPHGDLDVAMGPALIFNSLLMSDGLTVGIGNVLGGARHHRDGHRAVPGNGPG